MLWVPFYGLLKCRWCTGDASGCVPELISICYMELPAHQRSLRGPLRVPVAALLIGCFPFFGVCYVLVCMPCLICIACNLRHVIPSVQFELFHLLEVRRYKFKFVFRPNLASISSNLYLGQIWLLSLHLSITLGFNAWYINYEKWYTHNLWYACQIS